MASCDVIEMLFKECVEHVKVSNERSGRELGLVQELMNDGQGFHSSFCMKTGDRKGVVWFGSHLVSSNYQSIGGNIVTEEDVRRWRGLEVVDHGGMKEFLISPEFWGRKRAETVFDVSTDLLEDVVQQFS